MKAYGGVDVYIHIFLTSVLAGVEWSASRPGPLYLRGKSPRYQLDRMLGGPQSRSGKRGEEKILDSTVTRTPTKKIIFGFAGNRTHRMIDGSE
jgi:hypothetical protein